MSNQEVIIDVKQLYKEYKIRNHQKNAKQTRWKRFLYPEYQTIAALKGIDFRVNKGDILGYVGTNGAGKSTTIKILLGILKETSGEVIVLGHNPFTYRKKNAYRIGALMGQKSQLWWELPLKDSFVFLQSIYGKTDNRWLDFMIDTLDVANYMNQPVRELSLGQRMRGEFIATFIHRPDLVFLDEPTLGLDVATRRKVMEFLLFINEKYKTTIFFTSHELEDIEKISNRLLILDDGSITYQGDVHSFIRQYGFYRNIEVHGSPKIQENDLLDGLTIYRRNNESIEYLVNTNRLSEGEVLSFFSKIKGVNGVSSLPINLETILSLKKNDA